MAKDGVYYQFSIVIMQMTVLFCGTTYICVMKPFFVATFEQLYGLKFEELFEN